MCFAFLLMIPAFALYAYVFIRLSLVAPAVMVEDLGPRAALRRSWELVRDYWWRTFALILVLSLMAAVVAAGPALLLISIITLITRNFDQFVVDVVSGAVTVVSSLIFTPLQLIAITLYYFDQRVRKESFDIETAMGERYGPYGPYGPYPPAQPAYGTGYGSYAPSESGAATQPNLGYGPQVPQQAQYGQTPYGTYGSYANADNQPLQQPDAPPPYSPPLEPDEPPAGGEPAEPPPAAPEEDRPQQAPNEPRTGDYPPQGPAVAQDDTSQGRGQA
jgi:hypothetical protein